MSSIGKAVRRAAAVSLIAAAAALTLGVGSAAASTDKPPYDPKPVVPVADGYPGSIPAVAVGPGPLPAIVAAEPSPLPPFTGTDKPPYDPKS